MKREKMTNWRSTALLTAFGLLAIAAGLFFLHRQTSYLPILLLMLIVLLPALILLVLMLPVIRRPIESKAEPEQPPTEAQASEAEEAVQEESADPEEKKADADRKKKEKKPFRLRAQEAKTVLLRFYQTYRHVLVGVLIALCTAGVNVFFWMELRKPAAAPKLTYLVPTLMAILAVIFLVLEKLCKHVGDREKPAKNPVSQARKTYDKAMISGMRSVLTLLMTAALTVLVASVLTVLRFLNLTSVLNILLAVFFVYESVFLMISLFVRLVRREMDTCPELDVPFLGLGKGNLNVLSYLEKNTGITMRSLWSIRLMKQILPLSLVSIALVLWLLSGLVKIEPYQQGAHYRLGRLQEDFLQPGIHLTLPWPFDEVDVYDTENVNKMTIGYISEDEEDNLWTCEHSGEEYKLLLGDGKELVSINLRVEYKIDDLKAYIKSSASPESILEAAAYEAVTDRTICTDLETLLASDRTALAAALNEDITKGAGKYHTGLKVVSVVLESIHPPVEVAQIYQEIIGAEILAEKAILEAEDQAAVRVTTAKSNYDISVTMEERAYHRAVAKAKSEVATFMASVEADKEFGPHYRYHKYLKAVTDAYAQGKIILVGEGIDADSIYIGNFVVPENK